MVRNRVATTIARDQASSQEFLSLYYDLSKNWLARLVKPVVSSVLRDHKLNLDIYALASTESSSLFNRAKALFHSQTSAETLYISLMHIKVRVINMIDILMGACRIKKSETGKSHGIPTKLCEFMAKYFCSDGPSARTGQEGRLGKTCPEGPFARIGRKGRPGKICLHNRFSIGLLAETSNYFSPVENEMSRIV